MNIQTAFGIKVRQFRLERGLSQESLAERANLHRTYISSVELGKRNVSLKNIQALAIALDVPIETLFTDIEDSKANDHN